jgi:FkbM family methyltransferase
MDNLLDMNMPNYKTYQIRDAKVTVDIGFESEIGVYADPFWQQIADGHYEKVTFDFIENLRKSGFEYFLDIGAATGCMSLYAASTGLKVIAVEPQELVYSALLKNVGLNPSLESRIMLEYALVSGSNQEISVSEAFTPGAAGPIAWGALSSNSITLVELLQRCEISSKVALKIDIEGAEFPLFANSSTMDYLVERKPLIYIALHPGFKRPLDQDANLFSRIIWRLQATRDVINFYATIARKSDIYIASNNNKVGLVGLVLALSRDEKDYLLRF